MKVNIEVELSVQDMMDLLCTAFEGGVNYWVTSIFGEGGDTSKLPEGRTKVEHEYEWLAIGGRLTIGWKGEDLDNHFELNHGFLYQRNLQRGLQHWIYRNSVQVYYDGARRDTALDLGNIDAGDADEIVQFALFGELVFG
tara:strand:- start:106 stop:525 length:420 start_codon:yes stop_codon:yes gene_type:complete